MPPFCIVQLASSSCRWNIACTRNVRLLFSSRASAWAVLKCSHILRDTGWCLGVQCSWNHGLINLITLSVTLHARTHSDGVGRCCVRSFVHLAARNCRMKSTVCLCAHVLCCGVHLFGQHYFPHLSLSPSPLAQVSVGLFVLPVSLSVCVSHFVIPIVAFFHFHFHCHLLAFHWAFVFVSVKQQEGRQVVARMRDLF